MSTLIIIALAALLWLLRISLGEEAGTLLGLPEPLLRQLALGLSGLALVQLLQRLLSHLLRGHGGAGSASSDLLRAVLRILLYGVSTLLYLRLGLGLDISSVLATSALLSVIVGLALQPTLSHLFAGVSLEIERPLRVGDYVRRDQFEGEVISLNWRSVYLRTIRGSTLVLPNAEFTSRAVEIIPREQPYRHELSFSVASQHAPGQIIRCALQVLNSGLRGVCSSPPPAVLLLDTEAHSASLRYSARFFTQDFMTRNAQGSQFLERMWYALAREGIALADPPMPWPVPVPTCGPAPFEGHAVGSPAPLTPPLMHRRPAAPRAAGLAPDADVIEQALSPLPTEWHHALRAQAQFVRYGRGERCAPAGLRLVLHGRLREVLPPTEAEPALQRLLQALQQAESPPGPRRLGHAAYQALLQAGRLALGPVAEALVARIAALTDDAWQAHQALAASATSPELRLQLLAGAPAAPSMVLGPGQWAGLAALRDPAAPPADCQAEEDCSLLLWTPPALRTALRLGPSGGAAALLERLARPA